MLARSIEQDGIIAGLRDEIRDWKRKVRVDRQIKDDGEVRSYQPAPKGPPRPIPAHSAHSGLHPKAGCDVCAELAKQPLKEASKACIHPAGQRRGPTCLACSQPWAR